MRSTSGIARNAEARCSPLPSFPSLRPPSSRPRPTLPPRVVASVRIYEPPPPPVLAGAARRGSSKLATASGALRRMSDVPVSCGMMDRPIPANMQYCERESVANWYPCIKSALGGKRGSRSCCRAERNTSLSTTRNSRGRVLVTSLRARPQPRGSHTATTGWTTASIRRCHDYIGYASAIFHSPCGLSESIPVEILSNADIARLHPALLSLETPKSLASFLLQ